MLFEFLVSKRYLYPKDKNPLVKMITLITTVGITIGVAALIVVVSVVSGFQKHLSSSILEITSHIVLFNRHDGIPAWRGFERRLKSEFLEISYLSPFIMSEVMFANPGKHAVSGGMIEGIERSRYAKVIPVEKHIQDGNVGCLFHKGKPGIIMGDAFAKKLKLSMGDRVSVVYSVTNPEGKIISRVKKFPLCGIFRYGMYEYDSKLAYVDLEAAGDMFGMGDRVMGFRIILNDIDQTGKVAEDMKIFYQFPYRVKEWTRMHRNLFAAIKLEKLILFIVIAFIVLVASFNIASTLIMSVIEKQKDISIMKAMGAGRLNVTGIFAMKGGLLGVVGAISGALLGLVLCYILYKYPFIEIPGDVYNFEKLPVDVNAVEVALIVFLSIVISYLASVIPAYKAAKMDPAEGLRYE